MIGANAIFKRVVSFFPLERNWGNIFVDTPSWLSVDVGETVVSMIFILLVGNNSTVNKRYENSLVCEISKAIFFFPTSKAHIQQNPKELPGEEELEDRGLA